MIGKLLGPQWSLTRIVLAAVVLFGAAFLMAAIENRAKGAEPTKAGSCPGCPCEVCKCEKGKACPVSFVQKKVGSDPDDLTVTEIRSVDGKFTSIKATDVKGYETEGVFFDGARPTFKVNGVKKTEADALAWTAKTVEVKVEFDLDNETVLFYGGKPSYVAPAQQPAIPATRVGPCGPAGCSFPQYAPAPVWPNSVPFYGPQYSGGCANGRCGVPTIK